jgi:hydroxypyruvate reductase
VAAASPAVCLPPFLPDPPAGMTVVIGAGKAAASMAQTVEQHWAGELTGLVVTRHGHGAPCRHIEVLEASHPVPDATGIEASRRMIELVAPLGEGDLVLALISGGGSALLALPAPGIAFEDKQAINRALLKSGANIAEMNCVRKHLSAIKGGRLAAHCAPARTECLMISDVPGDDPSTVASGPTVPDPTTRFDAMEILARYRIEAGPSILAHLRSEASETPKPSDPVFDNVNNVIVANAARALQRAARLARGRDIEPIVLGDDLQGEARELGRNHAARALATRGEPSKPALLLSGGETTVTVTGRGRGGRNLEYLLALAIALDARPDVHALAADTDGIDGTEDNAGAVVTPTTLARARALGLDAKAHLDDNDAYGFFHALGDLVITGPTRTNVNDFRAILVGPKPGYLTRQL